MSDACRVQVTTWRVDDFNRFEVAYQRRSTTEGNTAMLTVDESFFTYELDQPVRIEPRDIMGIEMSGFCRPSQSYDNILALNVSGNNSTSLSYRRSFGGQLFLLDSSSVSKERNVVPLIAPVIGEPNGICMHVYGATLN